MAMLSNQPPKGMYDWFPEEFAVRKHIFDTWRAVCTRFGYQEYLTPVLESADIYRAKSGEDVGGKELMTMVDQGGRELAIRPEMTPSVTRMVSRIYESAPKPLRLFSIANFVRNEKPQKGRNREFWQLNADIFGSDSFLADVEILQLAIEIMRAFGADEKQFVVLMNDRKLIEYFISDYLKVGDTKRAQAIHLLDKFFKLPNDEFISKLRTEAGAVIDNPEQLIGFLNTEDKHYQAVIQILTASPYFENLSKVTNALAKLGLEPYCKYFPALVRGFDYYDGMVFEVFDREFLATLNGTAADEVLKRALFGGGRYNGLAGLFGGTSFPATGFAPGDETTKLFLEKYDLLSSVIGQPESSKVFVPLLDEGLAEKQVLLVAKLRREFEKTVAGTELQKIGKALEYADKNRFSHVALLGEQEAAGNSYKLKNLQSGEEEVLFLD